MMNLKHNALNTMSLFYVVLFLSFFSIQAQELDDEFLASLPENIKDDIISNLEEDDIVIKQSKNYQSFDSSIPKEVEEESVKKLKRFGDEYFNNMPSTFMPINDPAASSDYVLDVDDVLFIQLIGDRSDEYEYRIDRGGNISIPDVGFLNLAGLSLESARRRINQKLKEYFVETEAIISLKEVRDISILVTGYVEKPGFYILSGYSSIFHAIISAGGISHNGSYLVIMLG